MDTRLPVTIYCGPCVLENSPWGEWASKLQKSEPHKKLGRDLFWSADERFYDCRLAISLERDLGRDMFWAPAIFLLKYLGLPEVYLFGYHGPSGSILMNSAGIHFIIKYIKKIQFNELVWNLNKIMFLKINQLHTLNIKNKN